jgi:hypothetical protein
MFSLLHLGCTRTLDLAIAQERVRYAAERTDFHDFFDCTTLAQIQRTLRGTPGGHAHSVVVNALLRAQRDSPHLLWTLLLLQAFEETLVLRRRALALSTDEDPELDAVVLESFLAALENMPDHLEGYRLRAYALKVSEPVAPAAPEAPTAPASGVRLVA